LSLDTYANLKTEIADKLARSDITASSSIIDTAIDLVESEANTDLRMYEQLVAANLTTAAGSETIALPSDFLQFYSLYLGDDPSPLKFDTEANIRARFPRSQLGRPRVFQLMPANLLGLAPVPDAVYTAKLQYYAKIPALSDNQTTNWLLAAFPGYYYYGALSHLATYIVDEQTKQMVAGELALIKANMKTVDSKRRTAGAGMMAHVVGMTP